MKFRSPLRYPGGKSKAVQIILELLPPGITSLASPFIGGGSIEIALADKGVRVSGYDIAKPLVSFWREAIRDAPSLAREVRKDFPLSKIRFYELQRALRSGSLTEKEAATYFYVLNRASFSGLVLSGAMSDDHPRFTPSAIARLEQFKVANLAVAWGDFKTSIAKHPKDFLYCDPPYFVKPVLYGDRGDLHRGFDHTGLADALKARDGWLLSYNDCAEVRGLYDGYHFEKAAWKYGMGSNKESNEVLVFSKGAEPSTGLFLSV